MAFIIINLYYNLVKFDFKLYFNYYRLNLNQINPGIIDFVIILNLCVHLLEKIPKEVITNLYSFNHMD